MASNRYFVVGRPSWYCGTGSGDSRTWEPVCGGGLAPDAEKAVSAARITSVSVAERIGLLDLHLLETWQEQVNDRQCGQVSKSGHEKWDEVILARGVQHPAYDFGDQHPAHRQSVKFLSVFFM